MKKIRTIIFSSFFVFLFALTASAAPLYYQGFESDTSGWLDSNSSWYGLVTQVPDGTNGINSSEGENHAIVEGDSSSAPFSRFDGYRDVWSYDWNAEIDVYLDPNWATGEGFDYSVAASGSDGNHQRDFIFHVGIVENYGGIDGKALLVNGSNNADFYTNPYKLVNDNRGSYFIVEEAGWYTLQHHFYNDGGVLSVDLNLLDSNGEVLWTATRTNAADTIPNEVGGNRYAWFTHIDVIDGIAVDAHELYFVKPNPSEKSECKNGGWENFSSLNFKNQGDCVSWLESNENAKGNRKDN